MLCCTEVRAPTPIATVTMTAATPITMPSIVSSERTLLRISAASASEALREPSCCSPFVDRIVGDETVAERDDSARVRGDVGLVRDEHDRDAALFVETREEVHDVLRALRVELRRSARRRGSARDR